MIIKFFKKLWIIHTIKTGSFDYVKIEPLLGDKDIALALISKNKHLFPFLPIELTNDKKFVLSAISNDGMFLRFASENLKNDYDVVMAATKQNSASLQFASIQLQNNYEILQILKASKFSVHMYLNWFNERMVILNILTEEQKLLKNIPSNLPMKTKIKKF